MSGRGAGEIHFSLPETIESLDHLKATLAFHLRDACEGQVIGSDLPAWLAERCAESSPPLCSVGDDDLENRDHCVVERNWLKFAFGKLTDAVENLLDDTIIEFSFDGTSLTIRLPDAVIPVQATGNAWSQTWKVKAKSLRRLPKRLPNPQIEVGAWDDSLFLHIRIPTVSDAQLTTEAAKRECRCHSENADAALYLLEECKCAVLFVENEHFRASVVECDKCGSNFLHIFAEAIDWDDGDDSQWRLWIPIDLRDVAWLTKVPKASFEAELESRGWCRRYLVAAWPSGGDESVGWLEGPVVIPVHD